MKSPEVSNPTFENNAHRLEIATNFNSDRKQITDQNSSSDIGKSLDIVVDIVAGMIISYIVVEIIISVSKNKQIIRMKRSVKSRLTRPDRGTGTGPDRTA